MWKSLTPILEEMYKTHGALGSLSADIKYLEKAFNHTEKLWEFQFQLIERIHFILIGEAPLYGNNQSYFYNKNSAYTAFFRHEVHPNVKSTSLKKSDLLIHLRENGFIIIDLFPFAFNESTALNYRNFTNKKTNDLFEAIYQIHLEPKLKKIKNKSNDKTLFSLRYKKHHFLSDKINTILQSLCYKPKIECVGSSNMPINMTALEYQYKHAINDL